jgi:hypothetical protein
MSVLPGVLENFCAKCSETELLEEFSVHILYILYNLALEMAEEGWLRPGNTYIVYSYSATFK